MMRARQRGSLMIAAIVLILVIAFLGMAISFLSVTNIYSSNDENVAVEALVLAESGLERAARQWTLDNTYVGEGPVLFGNGSFTIVLATLSPTQVRITSTGIVPSLNGNVTRSVEAVVNLGSTVVINEPFTNLNDWTTVLTNNQGSVQAAGGGFRARTDSGANSHLKGTSERTLPSMLSSGQTVNLDFRYEKNLTGGPSKPLPTTMFMAIELVATDGTPYQLWSDAAKVDISWTAAPTVNWTVPAGKTIDTIRLVFDLQMNGNGQRPSISFDDIIISTAGGGGGTVTWQEIIP